MICILYLHIFHIYIYMFIQYITFLSQYSSKFSVFYATSGNPPEIHLVRLDDFREMQRMHPNFAALLGGTGTNLVAGW